jgi:aminocarboxymuconate-semialdehyde decarboxylase
VLHAYPKLKLVVAHRDGYLPAYSGRIDHAAAARPDCCEQIEQMPTEYLKRLYFDTIVFTHHQLEYLVAQYGADHVLMGTDYPPTWARSIRSGLSKVRSDSTKPSAGRFSAATLRGC